MNILQQNYFENSIRKETKMSLKTNYKSNLHFLTLEKLLLVIKF